MLKADSDGKGYLSPKEGKGGSPGMTANVRDAVAVTNLFVIMQIRTRRLVIISGFGGMNEGNQNYPNASLCVIAVIASFMAKLRNMGRGADIKGAADAIHVKGRSP
jgi:hypothetical protein